MKKLDCFDWVADLLEQKATENGMTITEIIEILVINEFNDLEGENKDA